MKKIAVTVAVLALGLAACAQENEAANDMTANEVYTENAADTDMNMAMDNMSAENVAENALENATQSIENAEQAVENIGENTTN
jgi:outer membrane lipoprotein SlyB